MTPQTIILNTKPCLKNVGPLKAFGLSVQALLLESPSHHKHHQLHILIIMHTETEHNRLKIASTNILGKCTLRLQHIIKPPI